MIVKCTTKDLEKLQHISIETFRETFAGDNTATDMEKYLVTAFHRDKLKQELQNELSEFYFAYHENELAGYLKINLEKSDTTEQGKLKLEIERLYVLQRFQKAGYGRMLMEHALKVANQNEITYVWLGVWEENKRAIQFYERLGFEKTGHHYFQLGDDRQKDFMMTLDLSKPGKG